MLTRVCKKGVKQVLPGGLPGGLPVGLRGVLRVKGCKTGSPWCSPCKSVRKGCE